MIRCVVIGAGGYTGAEIISLLLHHPQASLVGVFASAKRAGGAADGASRLDAIFPRFAKQTDLEVLPTDINAIAALQPDVAFLATPNEVSHDLAAPLRERGIVVLDLSGAFRLKNATLYPKFYGFEHHQPQLLVQAVYGLPELFRSQISKADLVAVPGCYPTSAILAIAPLARAKMIDSSRRVIIDAISGVSGAGRSPDLRTHLCEVSVQPYNVLKHRHNPEIDAFSGAKTLFTPHLGPYDRGILSTIHVDLAKGVSAAAVKEAFHTAYGAEPFVRLLPSGQWPSVAGVERTNFCDIGWAVDEANSHVIVVSAIDNLVKGAAGQAVQCMNCRFGLPETMSILHTSASGVESHDEAVICHS